LVGVPAVVVIVLTVIRPGSRIGNPWTVLFFTAIVFATQAISSVRLPGGAAINFVDFGVVAIVAASAGRGALGAAIIVGGIGSFDRHLWTRGRHTIQLLNTAMRVLSSACCAIGYHVAQGLGTDSFVLMFAAVISYILGAGVVFMVATAELQPARWWKSSVGNFKSALAPDLALGPVAFGYGLLYRDLGPIILVAAAVIGILGRTVFTSAARVRKALNRVEALYGFATSLEHNREEEATIGSILAQLRDLLDAQIAEVAVLTGVGVFRATLDRDGGVPVSSTVPLDHAESDFIGERAVLVNALDAGHPLRLLMAERKLTDAMIAPLRIDGQSAGTLIVASRVAPNEPFGPEELQLFEALAKHAAVSLDNTRLVDQLRWDSRHDPLTGLANRHRFNEQIEELIVALPDPSSILIIDLDRFKDVNDTLGHHHGDLLLREVSKRLGNKLGSKGLVARLGGDEFGVLLPNTISGDATQTAVALLSALEQPFRIGELDLEITASIGMAHLPMHGREGVKLLQRADVAMYSAKEAHSGWEVYSTERDHHTPRRLALAGELGRAIDQGDLVVHYQPKTDMDSGRVTGVEALVRWDHERFGLLSPDDFIPLAEGAGLIRALTMFVLGESAREQVRLRKAGFDLDFAVNLSVRSVLDVNLPDQVASVLHELSIEPRSLILEITEGSVMADPVRTIGVLGRLSELGVGIAIDDFGTGYSSLSYLKRLPVNEIKIDRSFVAGMLTDSNDMVIVRSTVDLAHNLSLRTVAEGVEDHETWVALEAMGCDKAQGYFVSPPLRAVDLLQWLTVRHSLTREHPSV
jgi:diguanylate cyclase (GGDEF)-like protein